MYVCDQFGKLKFSILHAVVKETKIGNIDTIGRGAEFEKGKEVEGKQVIDRLYFLISKLRYLIIELLIVSCISI